MDNSTHHDIIAFLSEQEAQALAENKVFAADLGDLIKLPFKLAIDLAAQLSQDVLKKVYHTIEQCPVTKTYPNLIDLWVDLESVGNTTMLKAKQLALLLEPVLTEVAPQSVLIIYLGDQRLTQDNSAILKLVHEQFPLMRVHFLATYEFVDLDKTYIPSNVTFSYLEKITKLKLTDQSLVGNSLSLNQGLALIDHTVKTDEKMLVHYLKSTDNLPYIAKLLQKIMTAQDYFEDIVVYVWYLAKLGASSLSINILEALYQHESDAQRKANYLVSLQFIRLVAGYFEQVIQEEDFPNPSHVDDKLFYAKAYCGMLSNQANIAKSYFDKINMDDSLAAADLQSLYRSNIYALLQHRLGNTEVAFKIEHDIEKKLNAQSEPNTQIRYINSLNLARLYRSVKKFSDSKKYYDLAYASICGLKSETDYVYTNINYASLYEGETDFNRALIHWLRATLHWCGMQYPESLGWRTARAILRRNIAPNEMVDINEINFALYQKLQSLAKILNIKLTGSAKKLKYIARKDELHTSKSLYYVGCNQGIGFICSEEDFTSAVKANQPTELLSCVQALLEHYQCFPAAANATQNIILDIDHGIEMPLTFSQIEKRCALLNIETLKFNHEIFHLDLLKIISTLTVSLSPALTGIDFSEGKIKAIYNRFYQDHPVSAELHDLFRLLKNKSTVALTTLLSTYSLSQLLQLEENRIIYFNHDDAMRLSLKPATS